MLSAAFKSYGIFKENSADLSGYSVMNNNITLVKPTLARQTQVRGGPADDACIAAYSRNRYRLILLKKCQNFRTITHKTVSYSLSVFTCHNINSCLKSIQGYLFLRKKVLYFISDFFWKLLYVYLLKSIPQ